MTQPTVITPVAPAVTEAPVSEAPKTGAYAPPKTAVRRIDGQVKKSYGIKPADHSVPAKVAAPNPLAEVPETHSSPDAPPAVSEVDTVAPAVAEPPKLTEADEAKRIARINRESQRLAQERQQFAQERQAHQQSLERVKLVEQAAAQANGDPLAFMAKAFGVTEQQILDRIISRGAVKPEVRAAEQQRAEFAARDAKIAELEKSLQTSVQQQQALALERQTHDYKMTAVAPVLKDVSKYELTLRALGDKATDEVFALQQGRYRATQGKVTLTPAQAADEIETYLRSQRDLLTGTKASVAPGKPAATPRTEPATGKANGSQTQKPATSAAYRAPAKRVNVTQKKW